MNGTRLPKKNFWPLLVASSLFGFAPAEPWTSAADVKGVVRLDGLQSGVPADWSEEKPDPPCSKQFRLEPIEDDDYPAQVTVCALAGGIVPAADELVKRWKEEFLAPEGKTMKETAKLERLTVGGIAATYLDVRGDYKGIPGDAASPREHWRLLAVYLNTPKPPYVIRLFGPANTVAFYRSEFERWIKGFK